MCDEIPLGYKRVVNTNVIKNKQTFLKQFHQQSIIVTHVFDVECFQFIL